ncbi:hypothetical protein AX16_006505 [Volvariella volvacea WC 439]|nr:hypothetical protein AX16_006505 [Volvariella volvacea WC 439]
MHTPQNPSSRHLVPIFSLQTRHLVRWIVLSACLIPLAAQNVDPSSSPADLSATLTPTRTSDEPRTTITTTIVAFSETQTFEITEHEKCLFDCTIQAQSELAGSIPDCTTDTMWDDICWCHSEFHLAVLQCMKADSFCQTIMEDEHLWEIIQASGELRDEVCDNETVRPEFGPSSSASASTRSRRLSPTQIGIIAGGLSLFILAAAYSAYTIYRRYRAQKKSALTPIPFPAERQDTTWGGDVSSGPHHQWPQIPWTGDAEAKGEEARDANAMEEASQLHPLLVPHHHHPGLDHDLGPGPGPGLSPSLESPEMEVVESSRTRPVPAGRSDPNLIVPYTKGALEARDVVASLVQVSQAPPMRVQTQGTKRGRAGPGSGVGPDLDPSPVYASDTSPKASPQSPLPLPPAGHSHPSPDVLVSASFPETPALASIQAPMQIPTSAQAATTLTPIRRMNTEARRRQALLQRELARVEAELREMGGLEGAASSASPVQLGAGPVLVTVPPEGEGDADQGQRQVAQLRREIERLNRMLESAWALGDSDVPPPGYGTPHDQ